MMLAITTLGATPTMSTQAIATGGVIAKCDPHLSTQAGALFRNVLTGVLHAQALIALNPTVVTRNIDLFNNLVTWSRQLGTMQGQIDACTKPSSYSVPQLNQMIDDNMKLLVDNDAKWAQAWRDRKYKDWMSYRSQAQGYYRVVSKFRTWLAATGSSLPNVSISTTLPSLNNLPTTPGTIVTIPGAVTSSDPTSGLPGSVVPGGGGAPAPATVPLLQRKGFWAGLTAVVAAGGVVTWLVRR